MKRTIPALIAVLAAASACSTSQITRTQQDRPTAPSSPTVQADTAENSIPAGTEFSVRLNEAIDTRDAGGTFQAEVAQTITDRSGKVLVPNGSDAELVVTRSKSGGEVGTRAIELAVQSVTVNGTKYSVTTAGREERGPEGLGRNRRTAEMVGGAAAIGALIGAIAGGGSGAAAGAAVGAAGGAAAQVLTRGDRVKVPAETVLNFRLDEAWQLQR